VELSLSRSEHNAISRLADIVNIVRAFEWVSVAYFGTLSVVALVRPLPAARRAAIAGVGVVLCAAIPGLARVAGDGLRSTAPLAVILAG